MNLLRRREMVQASGGSGSPLYPFPDYSSTKVNVYGGNAVSVDTSSSTFTSSNLCICPIGGSSVVSNRATSSQATSIVNNRPKIFTIPAGANVEVIYNVTEFSGANYWAANLRKANASTSLSYGSGNPTTAQKVTVSRTAAADEDVGAVFFYFPGVKTNNSVKFEVTVSLFVNGVRYI